MCYLIIKASENFIKIEMQHKRKNGWQGKINDKKKSYGKISELCTWIMFRKFYILIWVYMLNLCWPRGLPEVKHISVIKFAGSSSRNAQTEN